ncbi:protein phosphatase 1 regulatory subunit 12A-like isoform X1 [Lates japonicus]|uniref:Protein phosphatase 1 regulatory subunit 12A-like isoform X1 n=1 Tax=Lates japonicus TaxID=270547 RepID=A0AAD3NJZ1_LATJO|nr:protein phosphatase 1 regulatory subunit 12A-like isoform X1 [Lates japonicus]
MLRGQPRGRANRRWAKGRRERDKLGPEGGTEDPGETGPSATVPALLELERKDRRMLERRMAELEEELKVLVDLRADNQRLKDENGALIRVISKLSK